MPVRRSLLVRFVLSTVGMKVLMALTGAVLVLFLAGHVAGNLLVFGGPGKMNAYAALLRGSPVAVWAVRAFLLACAGAHVAAAVCLTVTGLRARPAPYRLREWLASTPAARTMVWSGPLIAAFLVYHLIHLTFGAVHPDFRPGDAYRNVVVGLRSWPVALAYLGAMLGIAFHLSHGVWSMCQTVGANHPRWDRPLRALALAFAVLLASAFAAIPVAVLSGLVS